MGSPLADAYDLIVHAEILEQRLAQTAEEARQRGDLVDESRWLETARERVARARTRIGDLPTRALGLPELADLRVERVRALQSAVVDVFERLMTRIVETAGERSPLIEVIYRNIKTPLLRRMSGEEFAKFEAEVEKRLTSSYASRMLADPDYAALGPEIDGLRQAFATWRHGVDDADEGEATELRNELLDVARAIDLPCRQARLLAEAALLPVPDVRESSGIFDKPKRRAARVVRSEAPSADDGDES